MVGYFSYTQGGEVFCDGDACIIAGSSEALKSYLKRMSSTSSEIDLIRKTRFGEIVKGLSQGGAYAFDEEACTRFYHYAQNNGIGKLPRNEPFSGSEAAPHFIRIQIVA